VSDDLDEFAQEERTVGTICWWVRLDAEQQAKVTGAKEAGRTAAAISRVVKNHWGVACVASSVGRHFRGECRCQR